MYAIANHPESGLLWEYSFGVKGSITGFRLDYPLHCSYQLSTVYHSCRFTDKFTGKKVISSDSEEGGVITAQFTDPIGVITAQFTDPIRSLK